MNCSGRNRVDVRDASANGVSGAVANPAPGDSDKGDALINRRLPKELLLRIFSYLDLVTLCGCARVCKYWNLLALDGSNWQKINLFQFQTEIEGAVVGSIAKRCGGFLKQLTLKGCQSVQDSAMRTIAQYCHNMEELDLNMCKKITDSTCAALGQHCHKLKKIDLGSCEALTDQGLKFLAEGCTQLKSINISWCDEVTDAGVEILAKKCPKLTYFCARGLTFLPDSGICFLARYCPLLEMINLHGCINLTDRSVQAIGEQCQNLRYICLSGCPHLTDNSLIALSQCQYLQTLEVAGCNLFTDYGFQALARTCHFLDKLDLEECVLITDQTLSHLAAGCPRLERLSLSHCELITDEGIKALGLGDCSSEHLIILELDNCPLITDASLDHLLSCHNLQRIDLYDCQLISREGIKRLKVRALRDSAKIDQCTDKRGFSPLRSWIHRDSSPCVLIPFPQSHLPNLKVHAYFAPNPPSPDVDVQRRRRCCVVL